MVNICLTRSGPGGARRDELTGEGTGHEMLPSICHPSAFEQDIVGNFHPYFHSLKPLIRQWFGLLHLAYAHHELYEYHTLHQRVIAMLEKAVATAPFEDDDDNVAKILEKRQKEIAQLLLPSDTGSKSVAAHLDSSPTATISQTHSQQRVPTSPPESPTRKRPRK
ncbi:hypothetical protein BDZ89DRAFT_1131949 [Hymenopellis radicata]|nr:hypothetical protein BDZ89DRAFT_1131949 [Hymenopellis radicata]